MMTETSTDYKAQWCVCACVVFYNDDKSLRARVSSADTMCWCIHIQQITMIKECQNGGSHQLFLEVFNMQLKKKNINQTENLGYL